MGTYKSQVRGKEETESPEKQKMAGEPELHQPKNHEEEVTLEDQGFAENDPEGLICSSKSLQGHLTRAPWLLLLLISLGLFLLMLATLVQVAVPQEQTYTGLEQIQQIQQQLTQFNASLAGLCRPCPWDWELFQGSCYLFSRTLGSWGASASSCKDLGAHLVIINSVAEQQFLKYWHIRQSQLTWIGLSDHQREGSWQWVDDTPLKLSFWKEGEPNNAGDEDCVVIAEDKWNDSICSANNFWVCEQPAAPCPGHGRSALP